MIHPNTVEFIVAVESRLDECVAEEAGISRSQAAHAIRGGNVQVNGKVSDKNSKRVREGDRIIMTAQLKQPPLHINPEYIDSISLSLLYEDDCCMVVDKAAGITVHPGSGTGSEITLIDAIRYRYGPACELVHRLDRGTTGCILIAKDVQSLASLQKQFKDRTVSKRYYAIVSGVPKEAKATIEAEIGRSLIDRTMMSLFRTGSSRSAVTTYEILNHTDSASFLVCDIHTGRTHQIRVHLASIGHPILGDNKYGTESNKQQSIDTGIQSMLLHSFSLAWHDPVTNEKREVLSPLPLFWHDAVSALGLSLPL